MKELEAVLKTLSDGLKSMAEGIETIANKVDDIAKGQAATKSSRSKKKTQAPKAEKSIKANVTEKAETAIDTVLSLIQKSRGGIDTATLIQKTGFGKKKITNIIYKLKKKGIIKNKERGIFIKS